MLRLAFLATVVAAALAVRTVVRMPDPALDDEWSIYKKTYNKVYQPSEDYYRRTIFETNTQYIEIHNQKADEGMSSFRLGMNEYGDMTTEEFVKVMNGYRMRPSNNRPTFTWPEGTTLNALPPTVDWRTKGYVTPIKNQGQCGSCWAFSATGSLEGQHFNKTGKLVSLSEQNLVDCSTKQGNQGCNGGLMDQAFTYIKVNKGIDTEVSYPYKGVDDSCHFNATNVGATDTGFVDVKSGSEADLQVAVASVGPVSVAIDANHISFQLYRSGVYHDFLCSSKRLDHGVLAVGYGTDSGKDYWLVKNSWGTIWGMKGYIMMSRNRDNNCGIATSASYPTV